MRPRLFVQAWRRYRGLSQERLAERIDRSPATVSRLERGLTDFNGAILAALAEALDCDPEDLFHPPPTDDELDFYRRVKNLKSPEARRRAARILAVLEEEEHAA